MQTESTSVENNNNVSSTEGSLKFVINFKKQNFDIACEPTETLGSVRQKIALQTGVAPGLQKLMLKGIHCLMEKKKKCLIDFVWIPKKKKC